MARPPSSGSFATHLDSPELRCTCAVPPEALSSSTSSSPSNTNCLSPSHSCLQQQASSSPYAAECGTHGAALQSPLVSRALWDPDDAFTGAGGEPTDMGSQGSRIGQRMASPGPNSGKTAAGGRQHVLPPCKVCEAPATGFHYGVNTCEACKGFFRRSLLRKEDYICAKSSKCSKNKGKRNMCAACRYQRCLSAGMSKEGIKTGRYTYEKRTSDILELKRLHTEEARLRGMSRQKKLTETFEQLIAQVVSAQERNHTDALKTNPIINEIHSSYLERKKQEARAGSSSSSDGGGESQAATTKPVSHDQYMGIYQATGVEVDDRRTVMETWIATAERGLKQMVSFAKDLPGFNPLPLPDQILLLKHSIAEAWVITRHKAFNVDHSCYSAHCGFTFDINKVFDADFVEVLLTVVRRLQRLELTHEETCVLKAMAFFFSDRCELTAAAQVDALQMQLMDALSYLLEKNHPHRPHMLAHIILVLTDLRTVTEMYHRHNEKILSWTDMCRAPLIWEVMSYSRTTRQEEQEGPGGGATGTAKTDTGQMDTEN